MFLLANVSFFRGQRSVSSWRRERTSDSAISCTSIPSSRVSYATILYGFHPIYLLSCLLRLHLGVFRRGQQAESDGEFRCAAWRCPLALLSQEKALLGYLGHLFVFLLVGWLCCLAHRWAADGHRRALQKTMSLLVAGCVTCGTGAWGGSTVPARVQSELWE